MTPPTDGPCAAGELPEDNRRRAERAEWEADVWRITSESHVVVIEGALAILGVPGVDLETAAEQTIQRVQTLTRALEWYADPQNYARYFESTHMTLYVPADVDAGDRARAALREAAPDVSPTPEPETSERA